MKKEQLVFIKNEHVNNNLKKYYDNIEIVKLYEQYIENVVELFDFIKNNESDYFYAILCDILIDVGFFSADRNFSSKNDEFKELSIKRGINIVNGEGICRNIACFYEDIFSYFCNYPLKMCCRIPHNNEDDESIKKYGNHIINLAYHHNILYGIDLTNHCTFVPIASNLLKGLTNDLTIPYLPNGDIVFKLTTTLDMPENFNLFKEINEITKMLDDSSIQKHMDIEEYKRIIIKANEFITKKNKILKSFIAQNDELTHEIKKKMLSLK